MSGVVEVVDAELDEGQVRIVFPDHTAKEFRFVVGIEAAYAEVQDFDLRVGLESKALLEEGHERLFDRHSEAEGNGISQDGCLLYTSPSPRDS